MDYPSMKDRRHNTQNAEFFKGLPSSFSTFLLFVDFTVFSGNKQVEFRFYQMKDEDTTFVNLNFVFRNGFCLSHKS